ncbi:MAG: hypothetical protein EBY07_12525 [Actinobacteria bacterium]|nr:hypothetical protein [Actinomycetota bacterium]
MLEVVLIPVFKWAVLLPLLLLLPLMLAGLTQMMEDSGQEAVEYIIIVTTNTVGLEQVEQGLF